MMSALTESEKLILQSNGSFAYSSILLYIVPSMIFYGEMTFHIPVRGLTVSI